MFAARFFHLPSQFDGSSRIPEFSGLVPACRQNPSTVRTKPRPRDSILMVKGGDELARGRIPEFSRVVSACRQDPSTVRTERRVIETAHPLDGRSKEAISLPEAASQSLAVLSLLAVRIRAPSGLNSA